MTGIEQQSVDWVWQALLTGVTVGITNYIANRWVVRHIEALEGKVIRAIKRRRGG